LVAFNCFSIGSIICANVESIFQVS
jgi:hypothetical protein